jgi:ATP-dependent DNA helicase RecQ
VNQERWMSDEIRVLVGTVAFGLGINKAAVRAVIHLSLPKSLEQYYQEAGRAGRDGLESDCVLLWQKKDAGLLAHFIEKSGDPQEQERAWQRYHGIRKFAESQVCRHRQICVHFGEIPKWERCEMCDVCGAEPDWLREKVGAGAPPLERKTRTRQVRAAGPKAGAAIDPELLDYLREWRRGISARDNVPAFLVLHDAALEDLCAKQPRTKAELLGVTGIGEKKAAALGDAILEALEDFRNGARAARRERNKTSPAEETIRLLAEGRSFQEIARIRERRLATIIDLVAELVTRGKVVFDPRWVSAERRALIEAVLEKHGTVRMKTLKDALPEEISYGEIRLLAAALRTKGQ